MSDTDTLFDQEEAERIARTEEAMREAGIATEEGVQVDYFGFEDTENVFLPDGRSYVTIRALNEGGRRRYLNKVNREVKIAKQTGDAIMQLANGDERRILLAEAIVGWNLVRANKNDGSIQPLLFDQTKLNDFLTTVNPKVIDVIDKAVRAQNPWLMADVTLEDLLTQRDELDEQIEKKRAEEEGKSVLETQANAFFSEKPIEGHLHESLRLYTICKMMKWTHLPATGGLYAQHPKFLDDLVTIAQIEGKIERAAEKKREAEMKRKSGGGRRAGRR